MAAQLRGASDPAKILERLAWFVTDAPLYHPVVVPYLWAPGTTAAQILPAAVTMPCKGCGVEAANWDRRGGEYSAKGKLTDITYTCRNCVGESQASIQINFWWISTGQNTVFEKFGRYPKFEVHPPNELAGALGEHAGFYRKGMELRQHNYGLGALVYFRRIVEDTTDELLGLLDAAVREVGAADADKALATIEKAKMAGRFEEKVRVAAEAVPAHLRMGDVNPLGLLYTLVSDRMHNAETDDEAIEVIDEIEQILGYLFTELKAHRQKRQQYAEGVKKLMARRAEAKKKSD